MVSYPWCASIRQVFQVHKHAQLRGNPLLGTLKTYCSQLVSPHRAWSREPGSGDRRPEMTGFLITEIKGFPTRIADRIVVPGREPVFMGIDGPGIRRAAFGNNRAHIGVGDHGLTHLGAGSSSFVRQDLWRYSLPSGAGSRRYHCQSEGHCRGSGIPDGQSLPLALGTGRDKGNVAFSA